MAGLQDAPEQHEVTEAMVRSEYLPTGGGGANPPAGITTQQFQALMQRMGQLEQPLIQPSKWRCQWSFLSSSGVGNASQWREYDNIDITDLHEVFSEHLVAGRKWGLNPRPARVIDQRLQKCQAE